MISKNVNVVDFVDRICAVYDRANIFGDMSKMLRSKQKDYVLLVSGSGLAMLKAKDCYVKDCVDNLNFKSFKIQNNVRMFMIEIIQADGDHLIGNVAKVEYDQFYSLVTNQEQPLTKYVLLKNGQPTTYSLGDVELADLARNDVIESLSDNDGGIYAAIDYINSLTNAQLKTADEKTFFSSLEASSGKEKIAVVIVKPKAQPYIAHIDGDITSFQCEVDGLIRAIPHALDNDSIIICNDSDKRYSYAPNRRFNDEMIHGTIVIAGFDDTTGEFKSLSKDQQNKYVEKYQNKNNINVDLPR